MLERDCFAFAGCVSGQSEASQPAPKRQRTHDAAAAPTGRSGGFASHVPWPPGSFAPPGQALAATATPSLEQFWTQYMQPEAPVVISGTLADPVPPNAVT